MLADERRGSRSTVAWNGPPPARGGQLPRRGEPSGASRPQRAVGPRRLAAALCLVFAVGLAMAPPVSSGVLHWDVDLQLVNLSVFDPAWSRLYAGPNQDVTIGRCGSLLAVLATFLHNTLAEVAVPHFSVINERLQVIEPPFNPSYVDRYIYAGPDGEQDGYSFGYKDGPEGTCAVRPRPGALQGVGVPVREGYARGMLIRQWKGFGARVQDVVDRNLMARWPTIAILRTPSGRHPQLIVGWNSQERKYLVLDPFQRTGRVPAQTPLAGVASSYEEWEANVESILHLQPAFRANEWFMGDDDPAPFEFLMTSPDGRWTGFDPDTGGTLAEDDAVFPLELGGWADALGEIAPGDPAKFLWVKQPAEGTYRLSVIGTGEGPAAFTLSTDIAGQRTLLETFDGAVAPGTLITYEARLAGPGAPAVSRVANFTPEAKLGGDSKGVPGVPVRLDASRSFDVDGTIVSHAWAFGDGTTGSGIQVSHVYAAPGAYTATLTVTDDRGATGSATASVVIFDPSRRGFGETVNVSGNPGEYDHGPQIAVAGGDVYVAWPVLTLPYFEMAGTMFAASPDGGATFGDPLPLAGPVPASASPGHPRLAAAGSRVYASWRDGAACDPSTGACDVLFRRSPDRGARLEPPIGLGRARSEPDIAASGDHVYVVWETADVLPDVVVRASADGGATFGPAINLSNTPSQSSFNPRMVASGSRLYVAWTETRPFGSGIVLRVSADGGASFGAPVDLSPFSGLVQIAVAEPHVYVLAARPGGALRVSADGGATFGPIVDLRDDLAGAVLGAPRMAVSGSNVYVAGTGRAVSDPLHSDVFFRASGDHGATFAGAVRLSRTTGGVVPEIAASGSDVYVGWSEQRDTDPRPDWFSPGPVSLFFRASADGGATFDETVTLASESVSGAFAMTSLAGRVFLAWSDASTGDSEIFFGSATFGQAAGPIANASGPYVGWATSPEVAAAIRFDGSRSLDPGGAALTARWDFGDGTPPLVTGNVAEPVAHVYAAPGKYTVTLVVDNGRAESEPSTTTAEVFPPLSADRVVVIPGCAGPGAAVKVSGIVARPALVQGGWNLSQGPLAPDPVTVVIPGQARTVPLALRDLSFETAFSLPPGLPPGAQPAAVDGGPATTFTTPCPPPADRVPVADAGGPYGGEVGQPVVFDGSRSFDPEGQALTYEWDFGDGTSGSGAHPQHAYAQAGVYIATLVVNDGTQSSFPTAGTRSFAKVTVSEGTADDTPPVTSASISPPPNAAGWHRSVASVALAATDERGGSGVKEIRVSLEGAQGGGGVVPGADATVLVSAEGTTTLTYFAVDHAGNQEAPRSITVRIDRGQPVIAGLPAAGCTLWPPDHRLVHVATVTASDAGSGPAQSSLVVTGTSNEPENGLGDGDTAPDVVIAGGVVQLRAERSGTGPGRVYVLTATARDAAGNTATATATCSVPHDRAPAGR